MESIKHAVVRTDRMYGTDVAANLVSIRYMGAGGDTPAEIDNGHVVKITDLMDLEREIFRGMDVASKAAPIDNTALIASPEVLRDERKRNLHDFYNAADSVCRGYILHNGDIFSVTKDALDGDESPDVGYIVELGKGTKLNVVKVATSGATVVGKIIAVDRTARYTYYVVAVNAINAVTGDQNMSIPDGSATPGGIEGKKVSDLIGDDIDIRWDGVVGVVHGTLNNVTEWTQFSGDESEQSGHFFPVSLNSRYSGKDISVTGSKKKTVSDTEWVLRVDDCKEFTFECDGETILKLDFNLATCK